MTSTPTRPVDNVVITTKGLQDRNTNIIAGTTVENKGKLILYVHLSIYVYLGGLGITSLPRDSRAVGSNQAIIYEFFRTLKS